ncbi:EamA family transporter [Micrococcaceae bacterium RIT802]|nr:EamA family transporter [Micrococcaceae bacterium RIT 802]
MRGASVGGVAAVLIASLLWGTTGTAATFAPTAGPLALGAAALGVGGLLQAALAFTALSRSWAVLRQHAALVISGAAAVFVYPLAFYSSMHLSGVAIGTVASLASAPIASGVLERLLEGRRLGPWWALATLLGLAGSVLLCLSKMEYSPGAVLPVVAGIGLGMLAGSAYAMYSWTVHRLMGHQLGRAASMGAVFGVGGLLLVPVLLATGAPLVASMASFSVAAYMALVPMFMGYVLFGFGLSRMAPSTATTITLSEPAVAAVLAVVVVGERMSAIGWVGLAVIGTSLVVLAFAPASPRTGAALTMGLSTH